MTGHHKYPQPFPQVHEGAQPRKSTKKQHRDKRNLSHLCKAVTSSQNCHLLNPQPWQNGHGSTPALVAMGFHFSPQLWRERSLHAEQLLQGSIPKIDQPCYCCHNSLPAYPCIEDNLSILTQVFFFFLRCFWCGPLHKHKREHKGWLLTLRALLVNG